jgi:hypothetical protein
VRPHALRVAGQFEELRDLGLGHEGALALDPQQPSLDDQLGQGLAHGGPRRAVPLGEFPLGRDGAARLHRLGQVEKLPLDHVVLGDPGKLIARPRPVAFAHGWGGDHGRFLPAGTAIRI